MTLRVKLAAMEQKVTSDNRDEKHVTGIVANMFELLLRETLLAEKM